MKTLSAIIFISFFSLISYGRALTGSFKVNGEGTKFYPVIFTDGGWDSNVPTELFLGRSNVHTDVAWLGSLMSKFTFHTSSGGHQASFINADIRQGYTSFIAGWKDVTAVNNYKRIIIWLKGNATYYYNSNYEVSPLVYDGVANPITYVEMNVSNSTSINHTFKTSIDSYVNSQGISHSNAAYFSGGTFNFFGASVGIGTQDTNGYKLAVKGGIIAESVKVQILPAWPDYVFAKSYQLSDLSDTERFIKENGHLPGIPSASEVKANGIDLGEMNAKLLQKIEELTLHLIQKEKQNQDQEIRIKKLEEHYSKSKPE
ncbi:hypothetical protein SAMN05421820_107148 [Pedobacter steynii]|uniref:Uncharacterized protein n=1 Tax=Pedobacter steynii TaxID=430522 RepID=A0A1H0ANL4_9SPHI|nr:hypothetical protein [Pedobacter steynii]NQX41310.1 hypothetical protein [Pedobacter steynii]SDN34874.1 hypothetical protein SAMN05421820_107148 [Pedobacter steynii]